MATTSYAEMADTVYGCDWIDLSPKLQKHLVLMIANAQRPLFYHGFNIAVLDLETLTTVTKIIFYAFNNSNFIC